MPDEPRQAFITFAVSPAEKEALQAEAARYGWSLNALVARWLGVSPWPESVPQPTWPPFQSDHLDDAA